jgi:SAM-dependent methyltransferase
MSDMKKAPQNPARESEPRAPARQDLELLDRLATTIRPDDSDLQWWSSNYLRQHRSRLAFDLEIVGRHVAPQSRVLECGAIPLLLTAALAARQYEVSAVDVKPERFGEAISALDLDVVQCDIENEPVPFAPRTFDAVLFNELFEHLRIDPVFTLRDVHRVLKPSGVLLLSTPNLRSFRGLRNLLLRNQGHAVSGGVYEQYEKLERLGHMGHVREYTTREVTDFLTRVGFRVERLIFRGGHGKGAVGIAERLAPSLRPFFTVVAVKDGTNGVPNSAEPGSTSPKNRQQ